MLTFLYKIHKKSVGAQHVFGSTWCWQYQKLKMGLSQMGQKVGNSRFLIFRDIQLIQKFKSSLPSGQISYWALSLT